MMKYDKEKKIFKEYLVKKGLRTTNQRNIILDVFLKSNKHLTPEELYRLVKRRDKSIGQATVYRTLKLLSDAGLAEEVDFGDGIIRYEHSYGQSHHDHLICQVCSRHIEVYDKTIEQQQEKLAKRHGFKLTGHRMYLYGICKACQNKRKDF